MIKATDIVVGTGKTAVKGALIITEYTGYLMDGTVFDASVHRGRPFECVIGTGRVGRVGDWGGLGVDDSGVGVVPMQVGGRRELIVPAHLAYGDRAVGKIPPNSPLRFEIELLEVRTRDD